MKTIATVCVLALTILAGTVSARADAVSDQKKAFDALGISVGKKQPDMCYLASKGEVERYFGKPVHDGTSAGPVVAGCAWYAADGTNSGILVTRDARSAWHPETDWPQYKPVGGVGEKAYTAYQPGLGYEAGSLGAKGFTTVLFSGKTASAAAALAMLRVVMNR
jgi:hypothetical protein